MCSSFGRCLLRGRNHINIHVCPRSDCWHTPEELVFVLLRHSQCLISSRKSCANLIIIVAIVTAAATRLASPLHTT